MQAAVAAQRSGRVGDAERIWNEVIAVAPGQPIALNALGVIALQQGDHDRAAAFLDRASRSDPQSVDLLINLAHVHRLRSDTDAERRTLEAAIALAPQNVAINVRFAEHLERMGAAVAASARWSIVIGLGANVAQPSAELRRTLDHARAYVTDHHARFGAHVDDALSGIRAQTPSLDRRRVDAALDHLLGRRAIYLNQCSGLHVPFLPAEEFFDRAMMPWLADLDAAYPAIRAEFVADLTRAAPLEGFTPYVDLPVGIAPLQWSSLDKSTDWSAIHLWRDGVKDEAVCARFPTTAAVLDRLPVAHLPKRMPTIFFSALTPGTHIPAHTGVTNSRAIIHLPLIVPPGCRFRVGGTTREWREGEAFAFDDTIEHEAWNDGDELRVVLILDAWNPYLSDRERDVIRHFYAITEASNMAPSLADRTWLG